MSLRAASGTSFAAVLAFVVACGGSTTNVGDGGADGGGGDGGGGDGGGSCTTTTLPGDRACVPGLAQANMPIEFQVDATDGCLGCFTTFDPCKVEVSGNDITISMITRTCPPPGGEQACPAICALPGTTCKLPPLAAGTYTVKVTGDGPRTGLPPRELVVTDTPGASTSCQLPRPPNDPTPLDGTKYVAACTLDTDCEAATVGNVCAPCKCPNAAIATLDSAKYKADYRAGTSQCRATNDLIACAACAPLKPTCIFGPNAPIAGTCMLK
jgi:hypothetical protein